MSSAIIKSMESSMDSSLEALTRELVKVRTGKASPALVDGIQVDYYGSNVPINQVANVTTPDNRTIQIAPWEATMIGAIEKSILAANLGLNPQNDGKIIRVPLPVMTEERRKEMVKIVRKMGEETKIGIRGHRRDANERIKTEEKEKSISEDDLKKAMDQIQKSTDAKIKDVDKLMESKEKEITTI